MSDIYFDQVLEFVVQSEPLHNSAEWHSSHPILAVSSFHTAEGGFISLFNEQGFLIAKSAVPGEGSGTSIKSMKWHPSRKVLAISCQNGEVYTWNETDRHFLPTSDQHDGTISVMKWSPCGNRLITADANGALVGWNVEFNGQLEVAFHHELKDQLTHIDFRTCQKSPKTADIGGLARAAVNGDEQALDLLSSTKNLGRSSTLSFYIGASSGIVYFVNADGSCMEVVPASYPIRCLLYNPFNDLLVLIDDSPQIVQYKGSEDGYLEEITKIKLSGQMVELEAIWAGSSLLALTLGEFAVRLWDVIRGDSYTLNMDPKLLRSEVEYVASLSFNDRTSTLVAGTSLGNVQMWSLNEDGHERKDPEKQWVPVGSCYIKGTVRQLNWNCSKTSLAVNTAINVYLLTSQPASVCFNEQISAVQLSANRFQIELHNGANGKCFEVDSQIDVRGIHTTGKNVAVWNGQKVMIYEINSDAGKLHQLGFFPCETKRVMLHEQSVYSIENKKIQVRTFQGTIKQNIGFLESEGEVTLMDICGTFLVAVTSMGVLKLWEISRREAKSFTNPKLLKDYVNDYGEIRSVKVNCRGTKVSILLTKTDTRLLIWDIEGDAFLTQDFAAKDSNDDDATDEVHVARQLKRLNDHHWDPQEPMILACELVTESFQEPQNQQLQLVSMFVTSEHGVSTQDALFLDQHVHSKLLGVVVPYYYLLKQSTAEIDENTQKGVATPSALEKVTMRDFVGLDDGDSSTRDAMMNFSFYMTVGNMDEAFKAIKKLKNGSLWENMARMCVKTKRLDVAAVCLGHMKHVRGAKALREAADIPEVDAKVGILAAQLGMLDEAEQLFKSAKRFDLLNRFYQASRQWKNALEVAESNDRINLRATYYSLAKYLESNGETTAAISHYEKSETHRFEVPRMLFDDIPALERYITESADKKLFKWWAQYMESLGEMETALQFYEKASDYFSLVRVYCYCNNLERAAEIANETGDQAACYHLGRQYENNGDIKNAVHFFTRAQAFNNAIRICKEQGMEDQLLNLALMGGAIEMRDVAHYYETRSDQMDKAVMLYHKSGLVGKAIDLAFQSNQLSALEQLVNDLDETVELSVLKRCAEFFMANKQPDKAVDLLAKAKEYLEAVAVLVEHNVPLTEEMAEKLTPDKDAMDAKARSRILEKIAECCYQQENYHLATKKFTQAGNRIKGMKALLKSGDTDKIVFFANVSRQPEIYIMAANYLQTLDWRKEAEIMKNVVNFYTKGKAVELLAGFYDACAQMEIDEFQNYDKALGALNEAYKCLSNNSARVKNATLREEKLQQLRIKLELVRKFVHIRRVYEEDETEAMKLCQALLNENDLEVALKPGDIYGFMVEHYGRQQNYKMAYNVIEEMRAKLPNVNLAFYIDSNTLAAIHRNLEIPYNTSNAYILQNNNSNFNRTVNGQESDGEEVDEDVKDTSFL